MLVDSLRGLYRCLCGRLYKDYKGLAGKCDRCRDEILKEWEEQG